MMGHYTIRASRTLPYPRPANKACHPACDCGAFTRPGSLLIAARVVPVKHAPSSSGAARGARG